MDEAQKLFDEDTSLACGLQDLGIGRGTVVYTATDLTRLPLPKPGRETLKAVRGEARRNLWLEWVYLSIRAAIGKEGTLVVPTFSYDYARSNTPFVYEESPGEVCNFSEYVRKKPGAVRSMHPLFSLTAVGPRAEEICGDVGHAAYGERSAFSRLRGVGTTFVFLGAPLGEALTYVHHMEQLYGVNHYFNKAFDAPAYKGGALVPGPWYAFVRYLGCGIEIHIKRFEAELKEKGFLRVLETAKGEIQAVDCEDVHREGLDALARNPWYFIENPVYIRFKQDNLRIKDAAVPSHLVGFIQEDMSRYVSK